MQDKVLLAVPTCMMWKIIHFCARYSGNHIKSKFLEVRLKSNFLHSSHHLPVQLTPGAVTHTRMQLATWLGNTSSLLVVHENDIYLQRNPVDPEQPHALRITDTGVPGEIFNGVPDWLYQGENYFCSISNLFLQNCSFIRAVEFGCRNLK